MKLSDVFSSKQQVVLWLCLRTNTPYDNDVNNTLCYDWLIEELNVS